MLISHLTGSTNKATAISYIICTYDCLFTPVLSMCITGAFNYIVTYYFCHKTPALIRWQYSAACWLTFCSSKLWINITAANSQPFLLKMHFSEDTFPQAFSNKILRFCYKREHQKQTPNFSIVLQQIWAFTFTALTSPRDSDGVSSLYCYFSNYSQHYRGAEIGNLCAQTSFWSLKMSFRNAQFPSQTEDLLPRLY